MSGRSARLRTALGALLPAAWGAALGAAVARDQAWAAGALCWAAACAGAVRPALAFAFRRLPSRRSGGPPALRTALAAFAAGSAVIVAAAAGWLDRFAPRPEPAAIAAAEERRAILSALYEHYALAAARQRLKEADDGG